MGESWGILTRLVNYRASVPIDPNEHGVSVKTINTIPFDVREEDGPFDLIGDVHGCASELEALLLRLGYDIQHDGVEGQRSYSITPPDGRKVIFLGDLVDRGPRAADVCRLVMSMVEEGSAFCILGNHEFKLMRWLRGNDVKITHGIDKTIDQFKAQPDGFCDKVREFLEGLPVHLVLDDGKLVVAHAGLKEEFHFQQSGQQNAFALYGSRSNELGPNGLPIRLNWAKDYSGEAYVVHGHVAAKTIHQENRVICLDTGCVFGGHLSALQWPEMEFVQVPAEKSYFKSESWLKSA
jgi:diadenosine tetraphosphatase ApaH/serine/threonine PP2A family protein phosphatase